jgi:F0F1-type ATP synthase assembly protein I
MRLSHSSDAVNARIRGSAMHRTLLDRLVRALPWTIVAAFVAGSGAWLLNMTRFAPPL